MYPSAMTHSRTPMVLPIVPPSLTIFQHFPCEHAACADGGQSGQRAQFCFAPCRFAARDHSIFRIHSVAGAVCWPQTHVNDFRQMQGVALSLLSNLLATTEAISHDHG